MYRRHRYGFIYEFSPRYTGILNKTPAYEIRTHLKEAQIFFDSIGKRSYQVEDLYYFDDPLIAYICALRWGFDPTTG